MTDHPYRRAAPYRVWRHAMTGTAPAEVDPAMGFAIRISPADRVVTAGSCFAQHIARALRDAGFTYLVTEPAHPILSEAVAAAFQYGVYSARYGNIYTARQFRQLLDRAHGAYTPQDDVWVQDGRFFDPFRPAIQPGGFATLSEYQADRAAHFAAIRRAVAEMDVLVFTLGLTEGWENTGDGAVYPLCPGTVAGQFDPARHRLHDFSVDEVVGDMTAAINAIRARNPGVRVILTVSPVALAATAHDQHVLAATVHAKSVLRVAAGQLARLPGVAYFPSYEIITGPHAQGYLAADLREVTQAGVDHVMRVFFRNAASGVNAAAAAAVAPGREPDPDPDPAIAPPAGSAPGTRSAMQIICEEESLGRATG